MNGQSAEREVSSSSERLISWPQLKTLIPLSRTTVWRGIRDRRFPAPIKISPGRVAWAERDILEWISNQMKSARP